MDPTARARTLINLSDASLGAEALLASDEFFAAKERMLAPSEPVFRAGTYDDHGQWMDGWETRRRRGGGHDSCIVRLAYPGTIEIVDIDTRHFTGNFPPQASVDATEDEDPLSPQCRWRTLLAPRGLDGNSHNWFDTDAGSAATAWRALRLNLFPDGGVARLRTFGRVVPDWSQIRADTPIDLFAIEHGGRALQANDQHYGDIRHLNRPGRGVDMGDGWETRRRREPGFDWVVVKLGRPGTIQRVEIDTAHYRGNFPQRVSLNAALVEGLADDALAAAAMHWPTLLPAQAMSAHNQHHFAAELQPLGPVSHVRMNLHPDGGVSRLRLLGTVLG